MTSNVKLRKRTTAVRFTETPLTVYDTVEWDPLDGFVPYEPQEFDLDVHVMHDLGDLVQKTAKKFGVWTGLIPPPGRVEGEEVGDDRVDLTLNPLQASSVIVCQEKVSRMVTSWRDTNISRYLWNFTEVTSIVPAHPEQSFDRCRKVGVFDDLGYVDVPPLRILMDVHKGDMSHSSTAVGKATMLGSRMRTPRTEFLQGWYLASYLQDGLLRTNRSSEPKYLPQIMGGSGVRAPFGCAENLYLSVHAYRGGSCQRIYGSATEELRQSLSHLEGGRAEMPMLNRRLRDKQEYLHGTYAEKVFIPTKEYMSSFGEKLPPPLIRASGGANLFSTFENRLQRTRHLVTRSSAEREWEQTQKVRALLLVRGRPTPESNELDRLRKKRARDEFGGALSANTALTHLLERKGTLSDVIQLTNENFHVVNCGVTAFTRWDAQWLFNGGKSTNFSIEDLTSSEDMFLRTDVSEDESMRVGGIPLRPIINNIKEVLSTTTVGLYQIGTGMYEWAEKLTRRLIASRDRIGVLSSADALQDYEVDPEWVNDDSLIIARCLRDTSGLHGKAQTVLLVSADKRLGHQLANTCNVQVVRLDPTDYILWSIRNERDPIHMEPDPSDIIQDIPALYDGNLVRHVYVDTGSVGAYLARVDPDTDRGVHIRTPRSSSNDPITGQRKYRYDITPVPNRLNIRSMRHVPVLKPKRYVGLPPASPELLTRRPSIASRSLSSNKSWRAGQGV